MAGLSALQRLQRRCRICAADRDAGVMIFGSRGHEMMLRDSILKYLHVEILVNDNLPKMVCIKCCTQIDSIRMFAEMASEAQITLRKHLESLDSASIDNFHKPHLPVVTIERKPIDYDIKSNHNLLDEDITELEVKVDPMVFLDSHTDDSQTDDSKTYNDIGNSIFNEEDHATLSKIENYTNCLTIELVKLKPDYERKGKALPDLKPIRPAKKFLTSDPRPHICSFCPKSFYSSIALQNHLWSHLNSDSPESVSYGKIVCPICRKNFSTRDNLKVHMETHRSKGKYNCDICGRIFKTQSNLFRHKDYHNGEVFTCDVCGRVYPTNSTLRAHSVTHSDARPHNCPLCKKTFKRNQDLKFHINQHTGARPYRCPYCPKAFASSGNCFSHRKRMHPLEVKKDREKTGLTRSPVNE